MSILLWIEDVGIFELENGFLVVDDQADGGNGNAYLVVYPVASSGGDEQHGGVVEQIEQHGGGVSEDQDPVTDLETAIENEQIEQHGGGVSEDQDPVTDLETAIGNEQIEQHEGGDEQIEQHGGGDEQIKQHEGGVSEDQNPVTNLKTAGGEDVNKDTPLSLVQFTSEMKQRIENIVRESVSLFQRDPREYHPFYLIIYKYLKIGQKLGYISEREGDEGCLLLWREFDSFAQNQWKTSKDCAVPMLSSEGSPYASYILTRKVCLNGRVMNPKRDGKQRLKLFKVLENEARKIRDKFGARDVKDEDTDLRMRLEFFKACKMVTFPGDVLKMNNIWTTFLSEDGFKSRRLSRSGSSGALHTKIRKDLELSLPLVENKTKMKNALASWKNNNMRLRLNVLKQNSSSHKKESGFQKLKKLRLARERIKVKSNVLCKYKNAKTSLRSFVTVIKTKRKPKRKGKVILKKDVAPKSPKVQETKDPIPASIVCDECGQAFAENHSLASHKQRVHNSQRHIFQCPKCQLQFKDGRTLWVHFYRNHMSQEETPQHIQLLLGQQNPSAAQNCRDMDQHNTHGLLKENYIHCPHCSKKFKDKAAMRRHVRGIHNSQTDVTRCDRCAMECGSIGRLWKHKVDIHGLSAKEAAKNTTGCEIKYDKCAYCYEMLLRGRQYSSHVKSQHPDEFEAWWKTELERRRERNVQRKRDARKQFMEEGTGHQWLKKEGGSKLGKGEKCPECGKILRSSVRRHLRLAHGVIQMEGEEWQCPKEGCRSVFQKRSSLVSHLMEVHCDLEEKIVEMKIIKFVKGKRKGMRKQEKTYICTICKRQLYHRAEVRVHIVAEHPDIYQCLQRGEPIPILELPCPHCAEIFKGDEELKRHMREIHENMCWKSSGGKDGAVCWLPKKKPKKMDEEEKAERHRRRKAVYYKYEKMRVDCEVCGDNLSLGRFGDHLKRRHGILESPWNCTICGKDKFLLRGYWLGHMDIAHGDLVDMEKMVERAKRVNNLDDNWTVQKVKEPTERDGSRPKRQKHPQDSGEKNENLLEKEKRLVIKVVRLSQDEILRYSSK